MDNFEFDPFFSIFAALWMKRELEEKQEIEGEVNKKEEEEKEDELL